MTDAAAVFSRSAGLGAKCDDTLKFRVPGEVKNDLQREAHRVGMTDAEFLRDLLYLRLYGRAHVLRMHEERLAQVGGSLTAMSPERVST